MKRVLVGISGGVDSSVAAILLKKQGYQVVGITFLFTDNNDCEDAKKVCEKLCIEHHVIDYRKEFKKEVIDKFISDYESGITPNPCVLCNKNVKLKLLYDKMIELNCDYIATGHYAKINKEGLFTSYDLKKDQTYFLCKVPRKILDRLLFPLEGISKEEVRILAAKENLITANKKDSTDVCFIDTDFKKYIKENTKSEKGSIINIEDNKVIGEHNGLMNYTIGQRRGLDIGGNDKRLYVVGKDIEKNILYVSFGDDTEYLISDEALIEDVNFISDKRPKKCKAKFRYRQESVDVYIEYLENDDILVKYDSVKSVTPGQICVLYLDNECIGGGVIKEIRKNGKKLWYI